MADRLTPAVAALPAATRSAFDSDAVRDRLHAGLSPRVSRELWKYTPLVGFVESAAAAAIARPELALEDGEAHVQLTSAAEEPTSLDTLATAARFPLADVALLMTGDCLILTVAANARVRATLTVNDGINVPLLIRLQEGASLSLVERGSATGFCNQSTYVQVAAGARFEHARASFAQSACHWSLTQVVLAADARYDLQQYQRGGNRRRSETHVILDGPGAHAELSGAYRVDAGTHLDQQTIVEHRSPGARSRQSFHGLGAGKGSSTFNGRIHIHPNAPGSDALLSNRNLALHPAAQINTKPELEIYTDDVRCAHGATVGKLSEESLFYLRSRGLDADSARLMLCRAFLNECIMGTLAGEAQRHLLEDLRIAHAEESAP